MKRVKVAVIIGGESARCRFYEVEEYKSSVFALIASNFPEIRISNCFIFLNGCGPQNRVVNLEKEYLQDEDCLLVFEAKGVSCQAERSNALTIFVALTDRNQVLEIIFSKDVKTVESLCKVLRLSFSDYYIYLRKFLPCHQMKSEERIESSDSLIFVRKKIRVIVTINGDKKEQEVMLPLEKSASIDLLTLLGLEKTHYCYKKKYQFIGYEKISDHEGLNDGDRIMIKKAPV